MSQTLGQVIRKHQIKNAGTCRLDQYIQQPQAISAKSKAVDHATAPQVRIIETADNGVVLEFTCPCGTKTYIQCDYNSEK